MNEKTCAYCNQSFHPSRFHPEQTVCASPDCQRRRRADYHKGKLASDPEYLEQCRLSQKKWREENPDYMKNYLVNRRTPKPPSAHDSGVVKELQRLLDLAKNNRVSDLKSSHATILLVCPEEADGQKNTLAFEKNTLAHAKLIVLQGAVRAFLQGKL